MREVKKVTSTLSFFLRRPCEKMIERSTTGRPWHYPLLVEKAGLAGPVDTSDPEGGAKQIQTSSKLQPNFLGPKHSILWKDLKCVVCRLPSVIRTY